MGFLSVKNVGDMRIPANELQGWLAERKAERDQEEEKKFMGFLYQLLQAKTDPNASPTMQDVVQMAQRNGIDIQQRPDLVQKSMGAVQQYDQWRKERIKWQQSQENAKDIKNAQQAIYGSDKMADKLTGAMNLATASGQAGTVANIARTLDEISNPPPPDVMQVETSDQQGNPVTKLVPKIPGASYPKYVKPDLMSVETSDQQGKPVTRVIEKKAGVEVPKYQEPGKMPEDVQKAQSFVLRYAPPSDNSSAQALKAIAAKAGFPMGQETIPSDVMPAYKFNLRLLEEWYRKNRPDLWGQSSAPTATTSGITHQFVPGKGLVQIGK